MGGGLKKGMKIKIQKNAKMQRYPLPTREAGCMRHNGGLEIGEAALHDFEGLETKKGGEVGLPEVIRDATLLNPVISPPQSPPNINLTRGL